jgi:hypothetical protein
MFINEQYMSATDKEIVLADWNRFIRSGFREIDFTRQLYNCLHLTCSFIPHTSQAEFWHYYFGGNAAMLAIFMNQFGGTKVSAETRWVNWRGGNAGDLKEAMIALAVEEWPTFESVLTGYAQERYEEEKWQDAREYTDKLPQRMQNADAFSRMALIFELTFPFEIYLDCLPVDEELRRRLTFGQGVVVEPPRPPGGGIMAQWNLNGRADGLVEIRQVPLFERQEARTEAANRLAQRIEALSTTEVLAGLQHTSPLIIKEQKILYADK